MKRTVLIGLVTITLLGLFTYFNQGRGIVVIHAQSLPITKTVAWDPNPAADNVTQYNLGLDAGPRTAILAPVTTGTVIFTTTGLHTIRLNAQNMWGMSPDATLTVNVIVPATPSGLRLP